MLYQIENPMGRAMNSLDASSDAYKSMMPNIPANQKPGPTAGGAIMSGAGGAAMGANFASMTGATVGTAAMGATPAVPATAGALGLGIGAWTGIGALLGIGTYFLS